VSPHEFITREREEVDTREPIASFSTQEKQFHRNRLKKKVEIKCERQERKRKSDSRQNRKRSREETSGKNKSLLLQRPRKDRD